MASRSTRTSIVRRLREKNPASLSALVFNCLTSTAIWLRFVLSEQRAVLDAARTLFSGRGYENTCINDIVRTSGVSVDSIYAATAGVDRARACCESAGHSHSLMAATSTVAS
ncbi:helix-turn-helix domain-containing protein [Streptomyces sp. Agncl-13]|uniref:helix-turn-helix domain-containing protein n=1 Tax=Streptomyces sp. Agncl-13 TaxID=3400628 RepID=UPI003A88BE02